MGVNSPTMAQADVFRDRDRDLASLRSAFPLAPGQCGAVLALGEERLCLDAVSRPDAWTRLYPKLLEGYLLDAIEWLDGKPVPASALEELVSSIDAATTSRRPSAGRGDDVRLHGDRVVGSGLELDGELIQLSAFSRSGGFDRQARIARPSARR